MSQDDPTDPYRAAREASGILDANIAGEMIPLILRHKDVRMVSKNWRTFSSDAPCQVPIPTEHEIRSYRQLPIEADPPDHEDFRSIALPFFRRPTENSYIARMDRLVDGMVRDAISVDQIEVVRQLALPLQSRALVMLLGAPEADAEEYISWGVHAFREGEVNSPKKAGVVNAYIDRKVQEAIADPQDDFFGALAMASQNGRTLTPEDMCGFINLALSGGRDTVINLVSGGIGYLAQNPEALTQLKSNPDLANSATEEFVRWISPLTQIGRVVSEDTELNGHTLAKGSRVGLNWASANRDENVFNCPSEVRLDRKPNPHVGFGSGAHNCLGAPQARLIMRTVLSKLIEHVNELRLVDSEHNYKTAAHFRKQIAYERLVVAFDGPRS